MRYLSERSLEQLSPCAYLGDRSRSCSYFLAEHLTAEELETLLAQGWRKFGLYFFRPDCPECRSCIPLRVELSAFQPSRSQKRILKRNQDLDVRFTPLDFSPRVFEIYRAHSATRFGDTDHDLENFLFSFYTPSCPGGQTGIYLQDRLIAVGWFDLGVRSLSSVYFCFDPEYSHLNLGTFGALCEIEHTRNLGLDWYYLGYYVPGNRATAYKDHFRPRQHFNWQTGTWETMTSRPLPT